MAPELKKGPRLRTAAGQSTSARRRPAVPSDRAAAGGEDRAAESTNGLVSQRCGRLWWTRDQRALQPKSRKMQDHRNGRAALFALKRNKSANAGIGEKRAPGFIVSSSGGFPVLVVHHPITIRVWNQISFILQDYLQAASESHINTHFLLEKGCQMVKIRKKNAINSF